MDRVDDIGGRRAEFPALLGGAGLYDYRMALRHAGHTQRPTHLEEPPMVIEHMHLCFIEITPARLVEQQRAVLPTVPQTLDHIDELSRTRVTGVVIQRCFQPEILGFVLGP